MASGVKPGTWRFLYKWRQGHLCLRGRLQGEVFKKKGDEREKKWGERTIPAGEPHRRAGGKARGQKTKI